MDVEGTEFAEAAEGVLWEVKYMVCIVGQAG